MIGFTKTRYKRIMDKLYLDRPMHKVRLTVRTNGQAPYNQVQINDIPCMINIQSSTIWNPKINVYEISNKIEIIIRSSYLKNKKFTNGNDLIIPLTLDTQQNGGYSSVLFSFYPTNTDNERLGYPQDDLPLTYGTYLDGGYGEYIKYVIIKNEVVV